MNDFQIGQGLTEISAETGEWDKLSNKHSSGRFK